MSYPRYDIKFKMGPVGDVFTLNVELSARDEWKDFVIRDLIQGMCDRGYLMNSIDETGVKVTLDDSDPPEEVSTGLYSYFPKTFKYRLDPPPE